MSDWEGGRRQGIRWRPAVVALVVVAVGGAAFYSLRNRDRLAVDTDNPPVTGPSEILDVVITAPLQADDNWYCPSTHPVGAYDEGLYLPAAYPRDSDPPSRPDRCYESAAAAEAAGYRLAPPPPGTVLVEGIYLEPTRSPSEQDCRELATVVRFTVPCPTRLPAPADGPPCGERLCVFPGPDSLTERRPRHVGIVIQHDGFDVPSESPWVGVERDVVLTAVKIVGEEADGALRVAGPREFVSCFPEDGLKPQGRRAFRTCVDARPFVPGFGGYPLESHTSAVWRRGDVVYGAGVDGAGDHVVALLRAVIGGIEYVDPPS